MGGVRVMIQQGVEGGGVLGDLNGWGQTQEGIGIEEI